ncbi:hypothetical protein MTP99_013413 [Tenebrio molitor]|jgi:hypothetical protein|uniref:uncharacterized protein n=1 Tax=Tenebrio molitor TaxID=7067 RepID=UPI001C39E515|nr:hypothetical protein MTP99_013413 [Tenebrio molitor]CAH1371938.1 unnamed protein product [Tenebrio molitor]
MRVLQVLVAVLLAYSEAQVQYLPAQILIPTYNISFLNWTQPNLNQTQWNKPVLNGTQWNKPELNGTQWHRPELNGTQWNRPQLNGTQWNKPVFNKTLPDDPRWGSPPVGPTPWNATLNHSTPNGDIIVGQIGYMDRLLFNEMYRKERRWWSGREKTIEYPKDLPGKYSLNRHETITAIRIYNKFYDGLHSEAKISSGGVGHRYVKIKLSSGWNKGFQYLVQIFGR